jgi:hypothetical protein
VQVKVDWERVGELVLDPDDVPDDVLLRDLANSDGRLVAFGPGALVRVSLEAWRWGVRVQQVAFELAKVPVCKWQEDGGDAIPVHRLSRQRTRGSFGARRGRDSCERRSEDFLKNLSRTIRGRSRAFARYHDQV